MARAAPEPGITIDDNLKRKRHNSKTYSNTGRNITENSTADRNQPRLHSDPVVET